VPWKAETVMSLREEFVRQALGDESNMSALCREYGISRKTGYKWLHRYRAEGAAGLAERSRRPRHSPARTAVEVETLVVAARRAHPAWGPRKLKRWLEDQGHRSLPAPSTLSAILDRHGLIDEAESVKHQPYTRFEMDAPNTLWQMDFKGDFQLGDGQRCHPLTVLDDHSRFLVGLQACADETRQTVQAHLTTLFRHYGLPERMLMDNGSPWGAEGRAAYTRLTVWLLRLGVQVSHGRPYHPQTQGKDERLHRTLQAELLSRTLPDSQADCQVRFDQWRAVYNLERPHEALDMHPPISRYQPSARPFPESLPPIVYPPHFTVRKVYDNGHLSWHGRHHRVGKAFSGLPVGLCPDQWTDGLVHVYFGDTLIQTLDLRGDHG